MNTKLVGPVAGTAMLLFNRRTNKILASKRISKHENGAWGLPGGKVDPGESPIMAIRREVREETLLEVEPHCLPLVSSEVYPEENWHVICFWFFGFTDIEVVDFIERDAHGKPKNEGWRWLDPDNLPHPIMRSIDIAIATYREMCKQELPLIITHNNGDGNLHVPSRIKERFKIIPECPAIHE